MSVYQNCKLWQELKIMREMKDRQIWKRTETLWNKKKNFDFSGKTSTWPFMLSPNSDAQHKHLSHSHQESQHELMNDVPLCLSHFRKCSLIKYNPLAELISVPFALVCKRFFLSFPKIIPQFPAWIGSHIWFFYVVVRQLTAMTSA